MYIHCDVRCKLHGEHRIGKLLEKAFSSINHT